MGQAWDYNSMTKLAAFVASGVEEYDRQDVESMVETCGWQTAIHFFARYENQYGANCTKQMAWIAEIKEREEE
tara:strand:+ start:10393 stop:10611 length:219 start_codon:yes stop_codon:yes gene_type:complete